MRAAALVGAGAVDVLPVAVAPAAAVVPALETLSLEAPATEPLTPRLEIDNCVICGEENREFYACVPCGHLCVCKSCNDRFLSVYWPRLARRKVLSPCPVCKQSITYTQRIFTA
jgi:hypothetical protein